MSYKHAEKLAVGPANTIEDMPEDQQTEFLRRAIVHSAKMVKINLNSVTGVNC